MIGNTLVEARQAARERADFAPLVALIPFAGFLGMRMAMAGEQPRSHLPFRPSLIGNKNLPAIHGGVTAAFMENAALLHLLIHGNEPRIPKSIDFSIDYLLPGRPEDSYADCEISRAGLRVAQCLIRCWQKSPAQPIAIARAHFLLTSAE